MSKATEEELSQVHAGLSQWCLEIMKGVPLTDKDGNAVLKEDGQPWLSPPSPAHLNVIRQFLKDNKIETNAGTGTPLDQIGGLPEFNEESNVVSINRSK